MRVVRWVLISVGLPVAAALGVLVTLVPPLRHIQWGGLGLDGIGAAIVGMLVLGSPFFLGATLALTTPALVGDMRELFRNYGAGFAALPVLITMGATVGRLANGDAVASAINAGLDAGYGLWAIAGGSSIWMLGIGLDRLRSVPGQGSRIEPRG